MKLKTLDTVALLEDIPEHGLSRGQVGTIVEQWQEGVWEVEFDTQKGTPVFVAIKEEALLRLEMKITVNFD